MSLHFGPLKNVLRRKRPLYKMSFTKCPRILVPEKTSCVENVLHMKCPWLMVKDTPKKLILKNISSVKDNQCLRKR
jgi:hypothetical protein